MSPMTITGRPCALTVFTAETTSFACHGQNTHGRLVQILRRLIGDGIVRGPCTTNFALAVTAALVEGEHAEPDLQRSITPLRRASAHRAREGGR